MEINAGGKRLKPLTKINILLGKNGSGKSTTLRMIEQARGQLPSLGICRYITPERGGDLKYEGGIETNIAGDPNWIDNVRRRNRYDSFRQSSVTEFRRLETLVLRKIEKDIAFRQNLDFSFDTTLHAINKLLDNVDVVRGTNAGFDIVDKQTKVKRDAATLSSGESELISLAIEILSFAYSAEILEGKTSYLFLDEPDVHLHPDLQARLMKLLIDAVIGRAIIAVIATHSTAILGALSQTDHSSVAFMTSKQADITFSPIGDALRAILPIFGAHPLSNIFNENLLFLVEGEDDERIWQQAVRSSQGRIRIWPCAAGDIQSLDQYESQAETIAGAVYEKAKAFSLRDRDGKPYEIDDKAIVKRMRLCCRTAENLLLSDDALSTLGINWTTMSAAIEDWLIKYPNHPQHSAMKKFKDDGFNRRDSEVKDLRNVFMMLAGSQKPWEVVVGQSIARLTHGPAIQGEHSLTAFLGPKLVDALNLMPPT